MINYPVADISLTIKANLQILRPQPDAIIIKRRRRAALREQKAS